MVGKSESSKAEDRRPIGRPRKTEKAPKSPTKPKSPGRAKSPGRPKSPGRQKSPARVRSNIPIASPTERLETKNVPKSPPKRLGRPKSPSRVTVTSPSEIRSMSPVVRINPLPSVTKRSPLRSANKAKEVSKSTEEIKIRKTYTFDLDSDSDVEKVEITKPKATVKGSSRKQDYEPIEKDIEELTDFSSSMKDYTTGIKTRRSTRIQENRLVHLKNDGDVYTKLSEFSDDEVRGKPEPVKAVLSKSKRLSIFGKMNAFAMLLGIPVFYLTLHVFCNEDHCSFKTLPNMAKYKKASTYFDALSFLIVTAYALVVAIISVLPFGGKRVTGSLNRHGKLQYVMNGWLSVVVVGATIMTLEVLNIPAAFYVRTHFLQLSVAATLLGVFMAIFLYARSFYIPVSALNPHALTDSKIYNFVMGREINPRIYAGLDLKFFLFRFGCGSILLLNMCLILESLEIQNVQELVLNNPLGALKSIKFNWTFMTFAIMQQLYLTDYFIFEDTFTTTFENQSEGLGLFLSVGYTTAGFIYTYCTKFLLDYGIQIPHLHLALAMSVFLIGYIITRGSNSQKHLFRQNPYHPRVAHLETLPTGQGKKLIVSGFWGIVRHPNYLGDILMISAWLPFLTLHPPVLVPILTIILLIHRSYRDGQRCKQRYGQAWERYCHRVPYILVPKVY